MILSHSLLQQPTLYNDKYNKSSLLILILLCIIYCITFQDTDPIVIIIQLTTVIKLLMKQRKKFKNSKNQKYCKNQEFVHD
eukprot:UN02310